MFGDQSHLPEAGADVIRGRKERFRVVIRLSTLNEIDCRLADGERADSVLQQPGRFALLVYLAMAGGRAVRRDTLLGLFWPDSPEDRARHRLSQAVYHLRCSLGRDVIHGRGASGYGISREHLWCDAVEFVDACESGAHERALELYRGEFLAGFFPEGALGFERWMEQRRSGLRRMAADAALSLAESRLPGDTVGAATAARRAMRLTPFDEPSVRRVIRLLAEADDRVGALGAYESLRERLSREFGAEPSEATEELVRAVNEGGRDGERAPTAELSEARRRDDIPDLVAAGSENVGPEPVAASSARGGWILVAVAVMAAVILGISQSSARTAESSPVPRVVVEDVRDHAELEPDGGISRAVTNGTLARLAEVSSFEVAPHTPGRDVGEIGGPSVILRSDLARSGDLVRVSALLLDAESMVTIGRGSQDLPDADELELADAAAAWLARFVRERAGAWMKERRINDSGATEATLGLIRAAVAGREQADSLAQVGSLESARTLLGIADSLLTRAEEEAPSWSEPSVQRAETALSSMWIALRGGALEGMDPRREIGRGLEYAERALSVSPSDPEALTVRATLTYWLWRLTPGDSAARGVEIRDRAERQLRELVTRDPTRARAWTDLSALLQARGAFAEARWAAERAYRADAYLDRTGSVTPRLFETALETGDLAAAERWCEELASGRGAAGVAAYCRLALLAWAPASGPSQVTGGRTLLAGVDGEEASEERWAPQLDGLMAVILARAGRSDAARAILSEVGEEGPDPEALPLHAWALIHLDQADSARALLDRYVSERPHTRSGLLESRRFQALWPAGEGPAAVAWRE